MGKLVESHEDVVKITALSERLSRRSLFSTMTQSGKKMYFSLSQGLIPYSVDEPGKEIGSLNSQRDSWEMFSSIKPFESEITTMVMYFFCSFDRLPSSHLPIQVAHYDLLSK